MITTPLSFRRLVLCGTLALSACGLGLASSAEGARPVSAAPAFSVRLLAGPDRFGTAVAVAQAAFPKGAKTVLVASGATSDLSDSLAANYLAGAMGAPILLVEPDSVPSATSDELAVLGAHSVVIVGGTDAVSMSVGSTLSEGGALSVTRVSGGDRFATAEAVDSQSKTIGPDMAAIVADGQDASLVDALGASPLAYSGPYPLFLVNGATGTLPASALSMMKTDGVTSAVIVGGSASIGPQVDAQLRSAGIVPQTEAGRDRSATSEALANYEIANFGFSTTRLDIASGAQSHLVDAMAGGPLGGTEKAPTLITLSASEAGSVAEFVAAHWATESMANVFGGPASVDPSVVGAVSAAVQPVPSLGSMSRTLSGRTFAPDLLSVGNFRTKGPDTLVDYTFDTAPTLEKGATGANFDLVGVSGSDTPGTGVPAIYGDVVTVEFAGDSVAQAETARAYVAVGAVTAVTASNTYLNPLEAVAVTNGGATNADTDLISADLGPSSTQVLYTFDRAVENNPKSTDFVVYDVAGNQTTATTAVVGGPGNTQVLATYTPEAAAAVGASVTSDGTSNLEADSVGLTVPYPVGS